MKPLINSFVSSSDLKELSILKPWKSILVILMEWLIIIACILLHKTFSNIFVYVLVCFVISTRLYAMYSLIHDAIHYSVTRNKMMNDVFSQIFLGFPLLISLNEMRKIHLAHHKYLQTDMDPEMKHLQYKEFQFPLTKMQMIKVVLLDISGLNFVYYKLLKLIDLMLHFSMKKLNNVFDILLVSIVFIIAFYVGFAKDLFWYWLIPYATLYQLLNRIRLSTEHFNIDENNTYKTRSVVPNFLEQLIFTPYNLGYHLEHHLYPGIPFYNLPKLHSLLIENKDYRSNAILQKSYVNVLADFIKQ